MAARGRMFRRFFASTRGVAAIEFAFLFPVLLLLLLAGIDGGRAVAALHPAIWLAGLVGLLGLEVLRPSPILPLITRRPASRRQSLLRRRSWPPLHRSAAWRRSDAQASGGLQGSPRTRPARLLQ